VAFSLNHKSLLLDDSTIENVIVIIPRANLPSTNRKLEMDRLLIGLIAGIIAGPAVMPLLKPFAKSVLKFGMIAFDQGRIALAEINEQVGDIVAEARHEHSNEHEHASEHDAAHTTADNASATATDEPRRRTSR
jgi:Protein of unknown function (DUF5132)